MKYNEVNVQRHKPLLRMHKARLKENKKDNACYPLHTIKNSKIERYSCKACLQTFPTQSHVDKHMEWHNQQIMHIHSSYVRLESIQIFKCDICACCFQDKISFKTHQTLVHTSSKPINQKSVVAPAVKSYKHSKLPNGLKMQVTITKPNITTKEVCVNNKVNKILQEKYKNDEHTCTICIRSFTSMHSLNMHIGRVHSTREKPFVCDTCGKHFVSHYNLKNHLIIHTGEKPYKCNQCEKDFSDPSACKRHIKTHAGLKLFKCKECPKVYASKHALHDHAFRHRYQRIPCKICPKTFSYPQSLGYHMKFVHGQVKEENKHECIHCSSKFVTKATLERHIKNLHSKNQTLLQCEICNDKFVSKYSLRRHLEGIHLKRFKFKCEICEVGFFYESRLKVHVQQVHGQKPKDKIYECDYCHSSYIAKEDLLKHIARKHLGIQCEICKKTFLTTQKLKLHKEEGCRRCTVCNMTFRRLGMLKDHFITEHVPIRERTVYECDHCSKQCFIKSKLKKHIRHQHGTGSYQCDHCKETFSARHLILDHIWRLHMVSLYCNVCMKKFRRESDFLRHKRNRCVLVSCEICNRKFKDIKSLCTHILCHGPRRFECDACGTKFEKKIKLISHIKRHHLSSFDRI